MRGKSRNEKDRLWRSRKERVRRKISRSTDPRLSIYRSARNIYAQLVDPATGRTIAGASSRSPRVQGGAPPQGKVEAAQRVGKAIAEIAQENGITKVVFCRNGFLYHGRVKALADAAREAGLRF